MEDTFNFPEINPDDYSFPFSDEIPIGTMQKLESALGNADNALKAFAANVLIGNIPAKKVSESVGDNFRLHGFHVKKFKFKDKNRDGKYTVMFGIAKEKPCAYCSTSDKINEAVMNILYVYGDVTNWGSGIEVKIRMNTADGVKAYSLEVKA